MQERMSGPEDLYRKSIMDMYRVYNCASASALWVRRKKLMPAIKSPELSSPMEKSFSKMRNISAAGENDAYLMVF